ncbi:MAG: nicotinamide mononucleotide transporter [Burkholderiales bacterium]|nr:MAG: nicotinamide mononucleotide transporter [Burkholderiales bacterium]
MRRLSGSRRPRRGVQSRPMLEVAFTLFGAGVTWLEVIAFALALGCVVLNVLEIHWAWPLAIAASLLYGWLFFVSRLYGDVAVQSFFVLSSLWGWYQWLFGRREDAGGAEAPLRIARLGGARLAVVGLLWLAAWPALGLLLARFTDTDVPYFNAFPTIGSFIGQILLALKFVETWPVWLIVNAVSVALYGSKSLWLTALLYVLFGALAVAGWRRWGRLVR